MHKKEEPLNREGSSEQHHTPEECKPFEVAGCAPPEPPAELLAAAAHRRRRHRPTTCAEFVDGILAGKRAILAQAITLVESSRPQDRALAEEIIEACLPHTGNSVRVGITGVPGAGKSSTIEVLGMMLIEERRENLAVLAIDPSSQISGGSILGDKTRMQKLSASDQAFIRPSPSRGTLGGAAQRTREAMLLCEAAGFKNILVETVGVGQSETAVHDMTDFFLLLSISGAGDELQGIKRGVMEMADAVAINKADGDNIRRAQTARCDVENALHYLPRSSSGWTPRALTCSAQTGDGLAELWQCVLDKIELTRANGWFELTRREQTKKWMHEIILQGLRERFESHPSIQRQMRAMETDVTAGKISSFRAARKLLEAYSKSTQ